MILRNQYTKSIIHNKCHTSSNLLTTTDLIKSLFNLSMSLTMIPLLDMAGNIEDFDILKQNHKTLVNPRQTSITILI